MLSLKIDVLEALKDNGYTTYVITKQNLISGTAMMHLRRGEVPDIKTLNNICCMLRRSLDDIVEWSITDEEKVKFFIKTTNYKRRSR